MKVYPEDIARAVAETKAKAENSKHSVQSPRPNQSQVDAQWESVKNRRQK